MGSKMLRFLLLGFFLVHSTSANCDGSTLEKVKRCYHLYMAGFNLTFDEHLPEYWTFHNVRGKWMLNDSQNSLTPICNLGNDLFSCVTSYTCLGYQDYPGLGPAGANTSVDYWQDLYITQYQCGPGFDIMYQEIDCIGAARIKYTDQLAACGQAYEKDFPKKGPCKSLQSLLICQANVMSSACDYNAGVFMCNAVLAAYNAMDPTCYNSGQVSCPNPRNLRTNRLDLGRF